MIPSNKDLYRGSPQKSPHCSPGRLGRNVRTATRRQCCQNSYGIAPVTMGKSRMATAERKADARRKIQLGGLIIKAGLAEEEPPYYLGCSPPAPGSSTLRTLWSRAVAGRNSATARLDSVPSHEFLFADPNLPFCASLAESWAASSPAFLILAPVRIGYR
jgi:Conjugal transfer protein TraD